MIRSLKLVAIFFAEHTALIVVQQWLEELKRLVPTK
jgi:hypothetical protein